MEINYCIALDKKVLVIASVNKGKNPEWAAYIGAVEGKNHEEEWEYVSKHGTKLSKPIAELLFPEISKTHRWRI